MKNKKLFAILTLLCFMMTLMPVAAFAAAADGGASYVYTDENPTVRLSSDSSGSEATSDITFVLNDASGLAATTTEQVYVWVTEGSASGAASSALKDVEGATEVTLGANRQVTVWQLPVTGIETAEITLQRTGTFYIHAALVDENGGNGGLDTSTNTAASICNNMTQFAYDSDNRTITVRAANTSTSSYYMTGSSNLDGDDLDDNEINNGDVVDLTRNLTANGAKSEEVELYLYNENDQIVRGANVSIETNSSNLTTSKTSATTNAQGKISFDVTALREGDYKIYVSTGSYDMTINVTAGSTVATSIEADITPSAPTDFDSDYSGNTGLQGKIGFRIYDASGSEVTDVTKTDAGSGMYGALNSNDDADSENFVQLVSSPSESDLDNDNFYLGNYTDEYGWTILMDETFDAEGTYEFKVILDNGASATVSIEVKEMGTPVSLRITYYTDSVELGSTITPRAMQWVDADGVTKSIGNNAAEMVAISGYAVENVTYETNGLPTIKVKDEERYVGSEITVTLVDERYNLVATETLTVADEATDLAFDAETCEVNVNNKITAQVVDKNGNSVTPDGNEGTGTASVVILDKPEGARVSATVGSVNDRKGSFDINLTSDTVGNVTIQAVLRYRADNVTKYYTGTQIFAVGNGSVGDVVVMSIGSNDIIVNDAKATIDSAPIIQNDRTYVPFRALAEAFGAEVAYDEATQAVTAELNGVTVVMTIGSATYTVNDEEQTMDVAPFINGSRTMVPVRFVAEAFGIKVIPTYDQDGATADILFNL